MRHYPTLLLIILLVIGMTSCNLEGRADYTPVITISRQFCIYHADTTRLTDTLQVAYDAAQEIDTIQTCHVGDTVTFLIGLFGTANNLLSFDMVYDSTIVTMLPLAASSTSGVLSSSTLEEGHYYMSFYPGILAVTLQMQYIAIGTGTNTWNLLLNTDSEFSPRTYKLQQQVRP